MADDNAEVIALEVDPEPAVRGANIGNAAVEGYGKKAAAAVGSASRAWQEHGNVVVRVTERSRGSVERLVSSLEKQAQIYGKTGVERLIAQKEQLIQRLGNEEAAARRVTAAYDQMIRVERASEGTGFNARYAFFGAKDIMEGRTKFAIAEVANELVRLKGNALAIGGAVVGIAALGFAAYEVKKTLQELAEQPEILRDKFNRFGEEMKGSNDELLVANDRLENVIAKLEKKPENGLKLAIDEAAVSADHLASKLDKSLESFLQIVKQNAPSGFSQFLAGGGFTDIEQLVGGKSGFGGLRGALYEATRTGASPLGVLSQYRLSASRMLGVSQQDLENAQRLGLEGGASAQQGRIETLRALINEIDSVGRAYGLEVQNTGLTRRKDQLEAAAEADRLKGEAFSKSQTSVMVHDLIETLKKQNEAAQRAFEKMAEGAAKLNQMAGYHFATETPGMNALSQQAALGFDVASLTQQVRVGNTALPSALTYGMYPALFARVNQEQAAKSLTAERQQTLQDQLHDDQRHLQFLEKQEQLELQIAKIHTRGDERAAIEQTYELRLNYAQRIYDLEKRTAGEVVANEKLQERQQDAAIQATTEMLQLQAKQFDHLKSVSAGLYETLFTHPSQFGSRLTSTIREAALKPVTEGLGGLTAQFLYPLFYGGRGGGGINDVRLVGGAVPVHIVNMPGSGNAGSTIYSAGGFTGGGSTIINEAGGFTPVPSFSPISIPSFGGFGGFGPGGTAGFAGPVRGLGGIFGGGNGGFLNRGNLTGFLSNLKGNFFNEDINLASGVTRAASSMGFAGDLAGVLTSRGAASLYLAAGLPLTMAGLTGRARGGAGGVMEAAGGGALIGAGIGTMILPGIGTALGAGIGAAAGFAAGIGEAIAGVESKQHEAHRLILSIYGVNIPEGSGIVNQIVGMSEQFGGQVSVAVRSSQVRQLIEMYAMSTGQKNSLFLTTPQAGHLSEMGGNLYQAANYFNGTPYTFSSSLPTLGPSSGTIPTFNPYAGGAHFSVSLDGPATTAVLNGQIAKTNTPAYIGGLSVQALQSNNSRYQTQAAVLSPGTIFA